MQNADYTDMLFARHDHTVIKLPPYMSNLNPIELAWRQVKDYVRSRNTTADMALTILQELEQEKIKFPTNDWDGHYSCVTNTEILIRG
jgi:transposase